MHISQGHTATIREFRLNSEYLSQKRPTQGTTPLALDARPPRKAAEFLNNSWELEKFLQNFLFRKKPTPRVALKIYTNGDSLVSMLRVPRKFA